jgi:hypothetical protein
MRGASRSAGCSPHGVASSALVAIEPDRVKRIAPILTSE